VQYVLPVVTNFLLFASPIGWAVSRFPPFRTVYFLANPYAGLIEAFRWSLFGHRSVEWGFVAYAAAVSILMFALGAFSFRRMERRFADVI
jgi:ABC-type polysaccharide/polyol phosphate export permease